MTEYFSKIPEIKYEGEEKFENFKIKVGEMKKVLDELDIDHKEIYENVKNENSDATKQEINIMRKKALHDMIIKSC